MFLAFRYLSLVLIFLLSLTASAQSSYFRADIPVLSQARSDQQRAAKSGLLEVLVRVSGSEAVLKNEFITAKASQALSYVSEFQFADVEDEQWREQGYKHVLQLSYSSRLVRKLLSDAQLPVWSINRPRTLLWLVEDSAEFGKRMVSFDTENPLIQGLEKAATYRGLPLIHPLLDFDDQLSLGAERLWSLDETAIMNASERYQADVILVGKYSLTSSGVVLSSWQYFHADKTRVYDLRAENAEEVGYSAVLPLANFLASLYSFNSLDSEYFSLKVSNVANFADYRGLVSTLTSFDTITEVKVDRVIHDQIEIRLKSKANIDQVAKQIALARKLFEQEPLPSATDLPSWQRAERGSPQNPLYYRWQR